MKRRKHNILLAWWPDDGWVTKGDDWTTLSSDKTFRTLKSARRHARYLMSTGKDEVEFLRRVPGGWIPERIWERIDR